MKEKAKLEFINWIVKKKKCKNGLSSPNGNFRLIAEKTEDDGIGV